MLTYFLRQWYPDRFLRSNAILQKSNDYNKIQNIGALLTPEHHPWTRPADKALYRLKRIQKV